MKLKKMTEEESSDIAATIDNEGFWYSLSVGGYLDPEDVLEDPKDIEKVKKAIAVIAEFERICPSYE